MNLISSVLVVLTCLTFLLGIATSLKCYNCGYFELNNGTKLPIHERWQEEKVAFCNDFAQNENNTIDAPPGGCCSAYKMKVTDNENSDIMWLSRHGAAGMDDGVWKNFTCGGEPTKGNQCQTEHIVVGWHHEHHIEDDGTVCHCYTPFCNVDVPNINSATSLKFDAMLIYVFFLGAQSCFIKNLYLNEK